MNRYIKMSEMMYNSQSYNRIQKIIHVIMVANIVTANADQALFEHVQPSGIPHEIRVSTSEDLEGPELAKMKSSELSSIFELSMLFG